MTEKISELHFEEWINHPVTKQVMKLLQQVKDKNLCHLLSGVPGFEGENFLYKVGKVTGYINAYSDLLLIEFADIEED